MYIFNKLLLLVRRKFDKLFQRRPNKKSLRNPGLSDKTCHRDKIYIFSYY